MDFINKNRKEQFMWKKQLCERKGTLREQQGREGRKDTIETIMQKLNLQNLNIINTTLIKVTLFKLVS